MSRVDELIQDLCPSGVEYEAIAELITRSEKVHWDDLDQTDEFRYIDLSTVDRVTHSINGTETITKENAPSRAQQVVREGDVLFGTTRPMLKRYCIVPADYDGQVASTGFCVLRANTDRILTNFLFHLLGTATFYEYVQTNERGASYPAIPDNVVKKFRIPVPPLEVQREIVRILDKFTQLEAELEAELEARRAQYEHYRNALLISSDERGVRNVSLGEIIRLNFGVRITKKNDSGTLYPVYGGGGESFRTDAFNREDEWVVSRFAMSANCVRRVDGKFWMLDSGFTFDVIDDAVDKDFVGQLLLSMQSIIFATSTQSAQKNIDVNGFKRLQVQFPSLATQQRVAASLANFDRIVNDLSIGLPAELAARRKQYEHYRDRLLTFKELAS